MNCVKSRLVKEYAKRNYKPWGDNNDEKLIEQIISNKDPSLKAYYHFLFTKISKVADAGLSEEMSDYWIPYLLNNTEYVINHIRSYKQLDHIIVNYISFSYYVNPEGEFPNRPSWENFKKTLRNNLKSSSEQNKLVLENLIKEIYYTEQKMIKEDQ